MLKLAVNLWIWGIFVMRRIAIVAAAIATFTFSGANAADLPLPVKAPPPPPPVWTWTGAYIGIEGGGAFGRDPIVANSGARIGTTITTINPSGGLVGGTIGYNYQFSPWFVLGIENDISWNGVRGTAGDQAPFNTTFSHSVRGTWLDTLRGRAGIVAWNNALIFASGGAAFAGIQDSASGPGVGVSSTTNVTGWTVGGGVEYMPLPNWSVKVEYLFVQFPTITDAFNTFPPVGTFVGVTTRLSENIVRAGVNWHFNWGLPLAR